VGREHELCNGRQQIDDPCQWWTYQVTEALCYVVWGKIL